MFRIEKLSLLGVVNVNEQKNQCTSTATGNLADRIKTKTKKKKTLLHVH